ncbi:MAG: family 20 glycosylhydrolase [Propionibacteriaceae bacterium]|nr:family 20 glycosylhydrolase [Propionibacteriaceae bacterium]
MERYEWRGLSLDIARSFFPPAVLRRVVDRLAEFDLNRLHLHLSDDQGWRLEIPSRPELTARSGSSAVAGGHGGFLSVDEYCDLVDYAWSRSVVVVPEIDLPGHTHAALHACPELNPGHEAPATFDGIDVGFSHLHPDLPGTETFVRDVLTQVAAMTPGPWVHIGADECPLLELDDYARLVRSACDILADSGKHPIAWQEAASAEVGPSLILQYWRTGLDHIPHALDDLLAQIRDGAQVILSPASHVYFDMKHSPDDTLGQDWAGHLPVEKVRTWVPEKTLPIDPASILGVEAAIWTERIHTEEDLNRMLLPRLAAFAEVANRPR